MNLKRIGLLLVWVGMLIAYLTLKPVMDKVQQNLDFIRSQQAR